MIQFLLLLFLALPAWGATYWVDFSGVGTGAANGANVSNQCSGTTDSDCPETSGDTVYLCGARSTAFPASEQVDGVTYDWQCPGGTPASVSVGGATVPLQLGARSNVTHIEPTIVQTGTTHCINATSAQGITIEGYGETTDGGTEHAAWTNNNDLGVIGPCGNGAFSIGNSNADNLTFRGLHFKQTGGTAWVVAPSTGTAMDNFLIEESFFEDCGNADGEYCIYGNAATGGTMANFRVRHVIMERSGSIAYRITGTDDAAFGDQFANPEISYSTSYDAGYYGAHTFQSTTGSAFQWHDANGMFAHHLTGVRPSLEGGVLAGFYSENSRVEDIRCIDILLYPEQGNGSFCVDADVGVDGWAAKRIYANSNPGHDNRAGCVGGNMCTGVGLGVFDASNVSYESAVLLGQRTCIYMSDPAGFPPPVANVTFDHITCVNPLNYGLAIQTNIADNEIAVTNSTFSGAGLYNVWNSKGTPVAWSSSYNNFWNGATLGYTPGTGDLALDPEFVGGDKPTTAEGVKLNCLTSPLKDAGTPIPGIADYTGRLFVDLPEIGAYACQGGTPRTTLTPRTTFEARTPVARDTLEAR